MDLGDETPQNSGAVRANCLITGYYVEELSEKQLDVYFIGETDFKISMFITRQMAPKQGNYSYYLKKFIESK